jgi:hypothetical protein
MGLVLAVAGLASGLAVEARDVGSEVASIAPATTSGLVDSFDGAVDRDPSYGLNDRLAARQGRSPGLTYTRVPGVWYDAPAPRPWYSQVNHPNWPGVLSFWLGTSAVRLDAPLVPDASNDLRLSATVDPVTGDRASGEWSSLVLAPAGDRGYVTSSQASLGVLVRSNGGVQVFQRGRLLASRDGFAVPDAAGRYRVSVSSTSGSREARMTVNSVTLPVTLDMAIATRPHLFLGAYLSSSATTSVVDDLSVGGVDISGLDLAPSAGLRYFGYYAARLAPDSATGVVGRGNHLPEVAGRSNLNWVQISDYDRRAVEVLDDCAPGSCVVATGHDFFRCDPGQPCRLYPNYEERWQQLADAVRSRLDRIAGFVLVDEPYHRGVTTADLTASARAVKATFPGTRVMMIEAGYKVTSGFTAPAEVDWVGFDWYCQEPAGQIERTLTTLESRLAPHQEVFLLPEAAPLPACGGAAGHATDADTARIAWEYLQLAERHPRVVGLMTFGLWVSGHDASQLPRTVDSHERIAARIVGPAP